MNKLYHTIIGLPGSGKTTFLAALWHQLGAGEINAALCLDRLEGSHEYLNVITEYWRKCEQVPRTSIAEEAAISIQVKSLNPDQKVILGFPDLSGESFQSQFATRSCKKEYLSGCNLPGGILLFINANRPNDDLTFHDLTRISGCSTTSSQNNLAQQDWSATNVPEAVRLVDLLQFILEPPFMQRLRKIAVIVSAWDIVSSFSKKTPQAWLEDERPLLYYFLLSNSEHFDYKIYGISAQGGALPDFPNPDDETRRALAQKMPSKRVLVVENTDLDHDLTVPLAWLSK